MKLGLPCYKEAKISTKEILTATTINMNIEAKQPLPL